jgi:hypothetical protein
MSSANKNLDLIKKMNIALLTSENSNYKQIKTNEIKTNVNISISSLFINNNTKR